MENIDIRVAYQAKLYLDTEKIQGYEVLARFFHKGKQLNTEGFIDNITNTEDKIKLTTKIIDITLNEVKNNSIKYLYSINISANEIENIHFKTWINYILNKYININEIIEFEITEKDEIKDINMFIENINYIKKLKFNISLDDIGAGYNTMVLIEKLYNKINIDYIKLDKNIVNSIHNIDLIECIIKLAKLKNIKVVAEGVEDKSTYEKLKLLNCDLVQGYFIHKPQSYNEIFGGNINTNENK